MRAHQQPKKKGKKDSGSKLRYLFLASMNNSHNFSRGPLFVAALAARRPPPMLLLLYVLLLSPSIFISPLPIQNFVLKLTFHSADRQCRRAAAARPLLRPRPRPRLRPSPPLLLLLPLPLPPPRTWKCMMLGTRLPEQKKNGDIMAVISRCLLCGGFQIVKC